VWAFPALFLLGIFLLWPVLRTIQISFYDGSVINPTREFVGVDNYERLLTDDPFFIRREIPPWSALFNSALWVFLFTSGVLGMGMLVAVLADKVRYEKLAKAIVFLPLVISFTAASVVFRLVYAADPDIGLINSVLGGIGLGPIAFLGEANWANFAIIAAGIWVWTSLAMTILAAAYKSLPASVLEAAAIDGSNAWQTFWRVSVPMMLGPIIVVAVTMIINALKAIDLVLVMTAGGPRGTTRIVGYTVFLEIFQNNKAGYGSAAAVLLLILMAPMMWFQLRQIRQGAER
jgi:alpha-glucoside transport system permease protein